MIGARSYAECAAPLTRFSKGDRVRYIASRANPPKTQSVCYTIVSVIPGDRFFSYRIKGDSERHERVAGEAQLEPLAPPD
jgi:hypothetical protein